MQLSVLHLCIQDRQLRGCYQYSTLVVGASTVYKASSSLETDILCTTKSVAIIVDSIEALL